MSKTRWCVALAIVLCARTALWAQTETPAKPLKRLLYLSFDDKLDAAEASGNGKATVVGDVLRVDGKGGKGALFVNNAHIEFDAEHNFDQNEGTLSMWVRPQWDTNDGRAHCLFEVPVSADGGFANGFIITKGWTDTVGNTLLYFTSCPPWYHINPEVSFEGGAWIHLTFTWSRKAGVLATYANGLLAQPRGLNPDPPQYPDSEARKIVVWSKGE